MNTHVAVVVRVARVGRVRAVLDGLPVLLHSNRRARLVLGKIGNLVKIDGVRRVGNHGVVLRAATKNAGARVLDIWSVIIMFDWIGENEA